MDFFNTLIEFFPNHTREKITETIDYVNSDEGDEDPESFRLERMIELLLDDDEHEELENEGAVGFNVVSSQPNEIIFNNGYNYNEDATGFNRNDFRAEDLKNLLLMFPNADAKHVEGFIGTGMSFDEIVDEFNSNGYVMKPQTLDKVHHRLLEMLPKVDPDYLREKAESFVFTPDNDLVQYVNSILDMEDLPSMEDYKKRISQNLEKGKYTTNFSVQNFLKEFPDPIFSFENPNRKHALLPRDPPDEDYDAQLLYTQIALHNIYLKVDPHSIDACLKHFQYDVIKCGKKLDAFPRSYKNNRSLKVLPEYKRENTLLLKELAFLKHKKEIIEVLNRRKIQRQHKVKQAREYNLLETCECCSAEELIPEEYLSCMGTCVFCYDCVKTGSETAIGDGKTMIACFNDCGKFFSSVTLQHVLDPVAFYRLEQRRQIEDIREANIDNFETCPFCDYGTVTHPDDKIFLCNSTSCGKESCRLCKHESHIPLKCSEIEYDEDVRLRTHIENKMTEALLRVCKKCNKKFVKEHGCNKMTCSCGTTMCYVCGASNIDYSHFRTGGCGLHTDQKEIHLNNVLTAVKDAKEELGIESNPTLLKFDPSRGIETELNF